MPRLLAEAAGFADEILVGVDEGSTDDTFEAACRAAGVVYRFRHGGELGPARMLAFDYTRCDWLLVLDDDEGVDSALQQHLPRLIGQDRYTGWRLPRKWIVNLDPYEFLTAPPWYPDYALRLFRADRRIAWKPVRVHSGMRVMGPVGWVTEGAILHYEPVVVGEEQRRAKIEAYRRRGNAGPFDGRESERARAPRAALDSLPPVSGGVRPDRRNVRVVQGVVDLDQLPRLPPWNAHVEVRMQDTASPAEEFVAEVDARNTGGLMWVPQTAADFSTRWPILNLSYRVRDADGSLTDPPGERTCVPRFVEPGETARFLCRVRAPADAGDYVLEWQLLSEYECWFTECGAEAALTPLRVTALAVGQPQQDPAVLLADVGDGQAQDLGSGTPGVE